MALRQKLWDTTAQDEVWTSPVVRNDTVYFGSADGKIYALTPNRDTEVDEDAWRANLFDSLCDGEQIFTGCGNGNAYSLDVRTGTVLWKTATGNGIDCSPVVTDEKLLIGSQDFFFYAMNANNGAIQWKYEAGLGITSAPAVSGDLVVFGSKEWFSAMRWRFGLGNSRGRTASGK